MSERSIAWKCLIQIVKDERYSNLVLRHELDVMQTGNKAMVTQLVYGTLQNYRLLRYDWEGEVKSLPPIEIAILLDMSVYQLLFMKQANYAVIDEAVQLSKRIKHGAFSKLVNAILRNFLRNELRLLPSDPLQKLGIQTSHPDWLIAMWNAQYGEAMCRAICEHDQKVSPQAIRVNTMKITENEFLKKYEGFTRHTLLPHVLLCHQAIDKEAFDAGLYSMQSVSSQLVAPLLDPLPNERILDICAAPGTKSCHIAQLMQDKGEIIACDLHAHRVELIKQGAERLGLHCMKAQCVDGTSADTMFEEASFDRILIDAPCSGYGTLQGKSDIRIRMKSEDMDGIIQTQRQILNACAGLLKSQGMFVYSTCTLNKKENEKQIENFLKQHQEYTLLEMHTIFPDEYDSDGFFMAKLVKA